LACTSQNLIAHNNLGAALAGCGQLDKAIAQYRKALEIKPDYAEPHNNLGIVLAGRGEVEEAIAHYRKALDLARQQNQQALVESIQDKIRLCEAGTRFRESPPSSAKTSLQP
jgi:Flp pilus assembly protein TadD